MQHICFVTALAPWLHIMCSGYREEQLLFFSSHHWHSCRAGAGGEARGSSPYSPCPWLLRFFPSARTVSGQVLCMAELAARDTLSIPTLPSERWVFLEHCCLFRQVTTLGFKATFGEDEAWATFTQPLGSHWARAQAAAAQHCRNSAAPSG